MTAPRKPRGGTRPGAGRPREMADGERLNLRVPRAVIERYEAEAERTGTVRAVLMRAALERYAPSSGAAAQTHGTPAGGSAAQAR